MKLSTTLFGTCIIALSLGSCVSSKKYKKAVADNANCESRYATLTQENDLLKNSYGELRKEKEQLQASSSAALQQKQRELSDKEQALMEREKRNQELTAMLNAQRKAMNDLKQQVMGALKGFNSDELTVKVGEDGKLYVSLSDKLLFASGSDKVNDRGKEALTKLAGVMASNDLDIMVEGHTDNVPISTSNFKDNWDLSVRRATNVTRMMIENGLPATRVTAGGRGEFHPVASNDTDAGKQQNRRTEIVLAPKLNKLWELTGQETTLDEKK